MDYQQKILPLKQVSERLKQAREKGLRIVHCHGCFDLFHPGHLRYLKAARAMGELLVVTVTPDRHVGKGPGRPVYNEQLRAESIAALEFVDYVAINEWPTAVETLRLLKPHYYVKGQEFEGKQDVTGKLQTEQEVLREIGSELRFTHDIVFSSSKLLNHECNVLSQDLQEFLVSLRSRCNIDHLEGIFARLGTLRVLVIGDAIIDEYQFVQPLGMSSKATMPAVRYLYSQKGVGGVLCIANHLAGFCAEVNVVTSLGTRNNEEDFLKEALGSRVRVHPFFRKGSYTTTKSRFLGKAMNEKLFEVQYLPDENIDPSLDEKIIRTLRNLVPTCDLVIVADYGHGIFTPHLVNFVNNLEKYLCLSVQTNSANYGFNYLTKYSRADYVVVNEREARLACQARFDTLELVVRRIQQTLQCRRFGVTLGREGARMSDRDGNSVVVPIVTQAMVDTVGAGDAFLSLSAPLSYLETSLELTTLIGNVAGAFAANITGNSEPINPGEFRKFVEGLLK